MAENELVNILVVDDLPEKLLTYRAIMEDLGVNLVTARSGAEALKQVLRQEFAVILMDVCMPGMDGFEAASLIRQRKKSARTPIIFLTAFTDEVRVAQGYASGAVDYLPTPVVPEILRAKVQVFIELFEMRRRAALQAEERARHAAAEQAGRHAAFLAQAGDALTRSLDFDVTVQVLASVAVPMLADISVLRMAGESARNWCVWQDAAGQKQTTSTCPFPWLTEALERVQASGVHEVLVDVPAESGGQEPLARARVAAALVLPVAVRSKVYGVLALLRGPSSPPYQPGEETLAHELRARAAIALENNALFRSIQEADQRKGEFLGMLAHELRNPLAPILNAVHLLRQIASSDPMIAQLRLMIERQVNHLVRLVDDLLDATRIARGKVLLRKQPCDLTQIVRQTTEDYGSVFAGGKQHLHIELPTGPVCVDGDPTRLAQVIGNLLHNAHKFTPAGGHITVSLGIAVDGQAAILTVRDTGIGIEPHIMPWVFEAFRQAEQGLDRSRGGLGLGLAVVKGFIELHGGKVSASSGGHEQGAEFSIQLPLSSKVEPPARVAPSVRNGAKLRILLIEDNEDSAKSAQMLLKLEGHEVRVAGDGRAGLETARAFRPQVVLCDIGLPGMDGYEVARAFRDDPELADVHLVALSGYGREEDQERGKESGFDMYLTKPIDAEQLCAAILRSTERVTP